MSTQNSTKINASSNVVLQVEPVTKMQQVNQQATNIPWGIISILFMLLLLGLLLFRKSSKASLSAHSPNNTDMQHLLTLPRNNQKTIRQQQNLNSSSSTANLVKGDNQVVLSDDKLPSNALPSRLANKASNVINSDEKMPDGIEPVYFLRQARGIFLHIQSINPPSEIAKYMTAELYQKMQDTINKNEFTANFSNLSCQLVSHEVKDNQLLAVVRFFGLVSVNAANDNSSPQPFSEIWRFIKPDMGRAVWVVSNIEQDNNASPMER